jgi:hypothetical protein
VYILADENAYTYDFWIVRGEKSSGEDVVLELVKKLPQKGRGHLVCFDSFYGGFGVARRLDKRQVYFICNCTAKRPSALWKLLQPRVGEARGSRAWVSWNRRILACCWRDKKLLNILTNTAKKPKTASRRTIYISNQKTNQKIEVPQVVELYRSTLGFVDRANAYRLRYPLHHRVPKHTRAQFYGMLGIAIVNSWILFKKVSKLQKYSYRTYLLQLIRAMAEAGGSLRRRATKNRIHRKTTSISAGTMKQMPHVTLHGGSSRGTCAQCKQRMGKACPRGGVSWYCAGCISADGSRVWYHLSAEKNCFAEAHFSGMKKVREG